MEKSEQVIKILRNKPDGLTITSIVDFSKLSRSTVRNILAKLEGGNKVKIRNIGMAKLYTLTGYTPWAQESLRGKNLKGGSLK